MIRLTRLSGPEFILNAEMIKFVEETPDTIITLQGNEKILVMEPADEVVKRVIAYARTIRLMAELDR